ncbi:MAG: type III pantothenate kinase [Staphylococcus sp.]|mgnify:FL=1|nr:type III pantothenate kinase [Staphylococcus sp.]
MILLFDIGNTNIVLGLSVNEKIYKTFRYVTNSKLTEDDYFQKINASIGDEFTQNIEGAIISSVVPQLDHIFVNMIEKYYKIKPLVVGPGLKSGLQIKLENPKQLGADLLCDAVGAYIKYSGTTIIIDMGTATKILVVTKNKEFIGGVICAGIRGSLDSLISTTSKLSRTAIEVPNTVIGNETTTCIQSGIVYGHVAMIEGLIKKFKNELGLDNVNIILTGGYAKVIKDLLEIDCIYDENILLDGLFYIYQKNKNLTNKS